MAYPSHLHRLWRLHLESCLYLIFLCHYRGADSISEFEYRIEFIKEETGYGLPPVVIACLILELSNQEHC